MAREQGVLIARLMVTAALNPSAHLFAQAESEEVSMAGKGGEKALQKAFTTSGRKSFWKLESVVCLTIQNAKQCHMK